MSDQPMAAQACEHYWAYHVHGGLSVRLCMFCHEPDWEDVRRSRDEAERNGRAFERAYIIRLAVDCDARYPGSPEPPHMKSFADRLVDLPPGWPEVAS